MPKQLTSIQTFLSAPSDVMTECKIILEVAAALNKDWGDFLSVRYDIYFYKNFRPGISIDAQSVINKQVPELIDLYIGILWNRIGTETERAISGTVEEFNNAYSQYQDNNDSIDIMVYFKEQCQNYKETDQQHKVAEFKKKISNLGLMYSSVLSADSFESMVRSHLSIFMQDFFKKSKMPLQDAETVYQLENYYRKFFLKSEESFNLMIQKRDDLQSLWEIHMKEYPKVLSNNNKLSIRYFEQQMIRISNSMFTTLNAMAKYRIETFDNLSRYTPWIFLTKKVLINEIRIFVQALNKYARKLEPLILNIHKSIGFADQYYRQKFISKKTQILVKRCFLGTRNEHIELLKIMQYHINLLKNRMNLVI